jgi:hypothetical protein
MLASKKGLCHALRGADGLRSNPEAHLRSGPCTEEFENDGAIALNTTGLAERPQV